MPEKKAHGNDPPELQPASDWTPLHPGGSNFASHHLVELSPWRLAFLPTRAGRWVALTPLLGGGLVAILALWLRPMENAGLPLVAGGAIALFGLFFHAALTRPRIFDKQYGLYWSGRRPPLAQHSHRVVRLESIMALQLLCEISASDDDYPSYELNLVLRDNTRRPVVDHGGKERILADGRRLAAFLGCPLWERL